MSEIASYPTTQYRPFSPLTATQHRRSSPDHAAPTSCHRRRRAEPHPNTGSAPATPPVNQQNCRTFVIPATQKQTPARLKSP